MDLKQLFALVVFAKNRGFLYFWSLIIATGVIKVWYRVWENCIFRFERTNHFRIQSIVPWSLNLNIPPLSLRPSVDVRGSTMPWMTISQWKVHRRSLNIPGWGSSSANCQRSVVCPRLSSFFHQCVDNHNMTNSQRWWNEYVFLAQIHTISVYTD